MNVINRSNGYLYIGLGSKSISIYTFKSFTSAWSFLNKLTYEYSSNHELNKLLETYYFEVSEFSLDFENNRFYVNGRGRYFKIRREGDIFNKSYADCGYNNEMYENVDTLQYDLYTTKDVVKNIFGVTKSEQNICTKSFVIPTKHVYDISLKFVNIKREIKLIEY